MNNDLKKAQNDFEKYFFKQLNNVVSGKTMENIEILNLSQEKKQELIQYRNQIIILQSSSQKIYQLQKLKIKGTYE